MIFDCSNAITSIGSPKTDDVLAIFISDRKKTGNSSAKHLSLMIRRRYPEIETFFKSANCGPFSRTGRRDRALSRNFSARPARRPISHHRRLLLDRRMWTRANNLAVFQFFTRRKWFFFLHLPPSRGICAIRGTVRVVPPSFPLPLFFSPSTRCFRSDAIPAEHPGPLPFPSSSSTSP